MKLKLKHKTIITGLLVFLCFLSVYFVFQKTIYKDISIQKSQPVTVATDESVREPENKKIDSIKLVAGNKIVNLPVLDDQSLYDVLISAREKGNVSFTTKKYTGLGFFVTDIEGLHQSNTNYLIYYINNKEASVGVSAYYPQNGDVVEWKLK